VGKANKLKGFEAIRAVHLVEEQFRCAVRCGTVGWMLVGAAGLETSRQWGGAYVAAKPVS
jgi:hypothetical protein